MKTQVLKNIKMFPDTAEKSRKEAGSDNRGKSVRGGALPIRTEGSWVTSRFPDSVAIRAIPEMPSKITNPRKGSIKDSLNLIVGSSSALCRLYSCLGCRAAAQNGNAATKGH